MSPSHLPPGLRDLEPESNAVERDVVRRKTGEIGEPFSVRTRDVVPVIVVDLRKFAVIVGDAATDKTTVEGPPGKFKLPLDPDRGAEKGGKGFSRYPP